MSSSESFSALWWITTWWTSTGLWWKLVKGGRVAGSGDEVRASNPSHTVGVSEKQEEFALKKKLF